MKAEQLGCLKTLKNKNALPESFLSTFFGFLAGFLDKKWQK